MLQVLKKAEEVIKDRFDLELLDVKGPNLHDKSSWLEHCRKYKIDPESLGVFYPHLMQSHIFTGTPHTEALLYHEHVGHGLFYGQTPTGLYIRNEEKEIENLEGKVREEKTKKLIEFKREKDPAIEGFAIWMEKYLLNNLGMSEKWESRFNSLKQAQREFLDLADEEERRFSEYGVIYSVGLPKIYKPENLVKLCRAYLNSRFDAVKLIILFGSKKPERDIDLYVVGDFESEDVYNGWLDMKVVNTKDFISDLFNFDLFELSVINNGEVIYGDKNLVESLKVNVTEAPITHQAVLYNIRKAERARRNIETGNCHNFEIEKRTLVTAIIQAEALTQGRKFMRIEDLGV